MVKISRSELLDQAFDVASNSPYIRGQDWGTFGDTISVAIEGAYADQKSITEEELNTNVSVFCQIAEGHLLKLTGNQERATELVHEITSRWGELTLKIAAPEV